ncbi:hypothetical protein [Streptomyces sp. TRM49041]|uniref:hypothetical protein n=1 Tax=Streptomyces sp. TRM49041 TaxID=2603216 RepID=UPI0011EE0C80|nr:hypothetical protein [Streptomyces sp. TRM49041]
MYPGATGIRKGGFFFPLNGKRNELARRISLDRTSLDLKPDAEARMRRSGFRGRLGKANGTQSSGSSAVRPRPAGQRGLTNRVGVRVYLDIGPGGEKPSDFRITKLIFARGPGGVPQLRARVRNTGARAVDISGRLILKEGPGDAPAAATGTKAKVLLGVRAC